MLFIKYYLYILEKIKSYVNNYYVESDNWWETFNYSLSLKFITLLQGIIDVTHGVIDYTIRINNNRNI